MVTKRHLVSFTVLLLSLTIEAKNVKMELNVRDSIMLQKKSTVPQDAIAMQQISDYGSSL